MLVRKGCFEEFQTGFLFFRCSAICTTKNKCNLLENVSHFPTSTYRWGSIVLGYEAVPYPRQREISTSSLRKPEKLKCFVIIRNELFDTFELTSTVR